MTFTIRSWSATKAGYDVAEYEDAYAMSEPGGDDEPLRIAVADGATESTFSALWAKLLANDYAAGRLTPESFLPRIAFLSRDWQKKVQAAPLPWHALAKVDRDGSHAALLGVTVSPVSGVYHALAVGDCSLFHLRPVVGGTATTEQDFTLLRSFPQMRWDDFNGSPVLIGTQAVRQAALSPHIRTCAGTLQPGDVLYLMSDALAAWFLRETEKQRAPWRWLAPLYLPNGDATLTAMVRDLRDTKRLKDDDLTVVCVTADV